MTEETYIDFTTEDVLVLTESLDLHAPPGLGAETLAELALAGNEAILRDAATRSLQARGVITDGQVVAPVQEVLRTVSDPGIMASVSTEVDGVVETRFMAAMPEIAVEHQGLSISLHRFIPFATRDLLPRILGFVDLRPYTPENEIQFTISENTLDEVSAVLDEGNHQAAQALLIADGLDEGTALTFTIALTMRHSSSSVTVLHQPEDGLVEGGSISWIDAGMSGLWVTELALPADHDELVEQSDEEELSMLDVRLTSAKSLAAELIGYLPEAFSEHGVVF